MPRRRASVTVLLILSFVLFVVHRDSFTYTHQRNTKLILAWVPFFGDPYYGFGVGRQGFIDHGCEVNDCEFTADRLLVPQVEFDAILFHGYEYYEIFFGKPTYRSPRQQYVFMSLESAVRGQIPERFENFYNLTMTYRLDSDFPFPYFGVFDKDDNEVAPAVSPQWQEIGPPANNSETWKEMLKRVDGKVRKVAWFVSHCNTESDREVYVREMSKYIDVDIYGKCGTLSCPTDTWNACTHLVGEKYFFYLAFENSLCEDYVTEKATTALMEGTVPIILSGAELNRFIPPGSYIDARTFRPKALARLIERLSKPENRAEYERMLWWREIYKVRRERPYRRHPFCQLCALLHDPQPNTVRNIGTWWEGTPSEPVCIQ